MLIFELTVLFIGLAVSTGAALLVDELWSPNARRTRAQRREHRRYERTSLYWRGR